MPYRRQQTRKVAAAKERSLPLRRESQKLIALLTPDPPLTIRTSPSSLKPSQFTNITREIVDNREVNMGRRISKSVLR
jgi:hypothetical protein